MKKNLFKINENDRFNILEMHRRATKNQYLFEQDPALVTTTTTLAPVATTTTPESTTTTVKRYSSLTCSGKPNCVDKVLKIQARMNDECPSDILTVKLVEDGKWGSKSSSAFESCKSKLTQTKKTDQNLAQQQTTDTTISKDTLNALIS